VFLNGSFRGGVGGDGGLNVASGVGASRELLALHWRSCIRCGCHFENAPIESREKDGSMKTTEKKRASWVETRVLRSGSFAVRFPRSRRRKPTHNPDRHPKLPTSIFSLHQRPV
jgi:hypothetical protein